MLISFTNKLQKIASITLALFVGSWLLFLCQTCLASVNNSQQHNQAVVDTTTSCHESAPVDHEDNAGHKHCLGVCDCDAMAITMNSDKAVDLVQKIKYIPDLFFYIESQPVLSYLAPPTSRIFTPPERAILLPLQSYNVLLI